MTIMIRVLVSVPPTVNHSGLMMAVTVTMVIMLRHAYNALRLPRIYAARRTGR